MNMQPLKCVKLKKIEKDANFLLASNIYNIRTELGKGNLQAAHKKIMSFLEIMLKFFGAILYSDFMHNTDGQQGETITKIIELLKKPSNGHWISFSREIMKKSRELKLELSMPSLVEDLSKKRTGNALIIDNRTKLVDFIRDKKSNYQASNLNSPTLFMCLEDLVAYRNVFHGHGDMSDYEYQLHLPVLVALLEEMLGEIKVVGESRLAYLQQVTVKNKKFFLDFIIWESSNMNPEMHKDESESPMESEKVYLCKYDDKDDELVPLFSLHPMLVLRHDPKMGRQNIYCLSDISTDHASYISYPHYDLIEPKQPGDILECLLTSTAELPSSKGKGKVFRAEQLADNIRSMEMIIPAENPQIWENFEGVYYAYNAPFQLEKDALKLELMVAKHADRYRNDSMEKAVYLFFTGDLNNPDDRLKFETRLDNFRIFMTGLLKAIPDILPKKLEVFFCRSEFPNLTFFSGKKLEMDYGIIYFHNEVFLEADIPKIAFMTKDEAVVGDLRTTFEENISSLITHQYSVEEIVREDNFSEKIVKEFLSPFIIRDEIAKMHFSPTLEIHEHVNQERKKGNDIYHMGFGQAPFPVPNRVQKELGKNADKNMYLPTAGLGELREAALEYFSERFGFKKEDYIAIIGPGSKELIYDIQMAVKGDFLMPVPSWVSYGPQAEMLDDDIIRITTSVEEKYHITGESLEKAIGAARKEGKNPKKIILNYPNNPSGYSIDDKQLEAIAEVCRRHDILVISDEIYGLVHFKGDHKSISRFYQEGTIITTGLSKHISLGGYRLGIAFIPKSMEYVFDSLCRIGSETWSAVSSPVQFAALSALDGHAEIEDFVEDSTKIHGIVTEFVRNTMETIGVKYPKLDGAFYLYPDFEIFRFSLKEKYQVQTSRDLANDLISRINVATLPGTAFGEEPEVLRLRLATCDFNGAQALNIYRDNPGIKAEEFMKKACPNIVESCKRLINYFDELR